MSQKEDYYNTLGISKTADDATIKKRIDGWPSSTTRIPMPGTQGLNKNLKR